MKLSEEQIAYLKSLDSKKKRRKFMLDCLVDSVIGELAKIDPSKVINFTNGKFEATSQEQIDFLKGFNGCLFTNTTAPRTFEGLESFAEKNKWDLTTKLEDIIKSKLLIRGFKNEDLLNARGLIGATIDETVLELVKNYQSANTSKVDEFKLPPNCNFIPSEGIDVWDEKEFFKRNGIFKITQNDGTVLYGKSTFNESAKKNFSDFDSHLLVEENHLCWIYNRLISVYGENPLFDYMHKLREIATTYNPEKKYTEEDMNKYALFVRKNDVITPSEWFDKFKK